MRLAFWMEILGQDIAHPAVRVVDHDLGRSGFEQPNDDGVDVLGHPFPGVLIVARRRVRMVAVDDAPDPFHVRRDEDLERSLRLRRSRRSRRALRAQNENHDLFHVDLFIDG